MDPLVIIGTVTSGQGIGSKFLSLPWVIQQIDEKLGFHPYHGTLNLRLPKARAEQARRRLQTAKGITITPAPGYFPARCFKMSIRNYIDGAILIPQTPNYPATLLEVIAPLDLRDVLVLADGDEVELTIILDSTTP